MDVNKNKFIDKYKYLHINDKKLYKNNISIFY